MRLDFVASLYQSSLYPSNIAETAHLAYKSVEKYYGGMAIFLFLKMQNYFEYKTIICLFHDFINIVISVDKSLI